jgi:hypothetical protein
MSLKIIYGDEQRVVFVDRQADTLQTLLVSACGLFGVSVEGLRLRAYNVHNQIMMETYTGLEQLSLEELRIYPMKTLCLEGLPWKEYDPTMMLLKVNLWREGIQALTEDILQPTPVYVKKDIMLQELKQQLSSQFNLKDCQIMKRNPMLN